MPVVYTQLRSFFPFNTPPFFQLLFSVPTSGMLCGSPHLRDGAKVESVLFKSCSGVHLMNGAKVKIVISKSCSGDHLLVFT